MSILTDYVAVPEHIRGAGAITWWTLAGRIPYDILRERWEDTGLPLHDCPSAPSRLAALREAVDSVARGALFRRRSEDWWLVCHGSEEDRRWRGEEVARVRIKPAADVLILGPEEELEVEGGPALLTNKLVEGYVEARSYWGTDSLSNWLPTYLYGRCDATLLRRTGGVWYLPPHALPQWNQVQQVLCEGTRHRFCELEVLKTERAIMEILDGLTIEIDGAIERALEEATTPRRAENRVELLRGLTNKLGLYEETLGAKAEELSQQIEKAHNALALIAMAAQAEE